jgi:hypothetical protein
VTSGYSIKNIPNYQPKENIAGPSVGLIQMQNLMLNLDLHSKLLGKTCEEENLEKSISLFYPDK